MKIDDILNSLLMITVCFLIFVAIGKHVKAGSAVDYIAAMRYTLDAIYAILMAIVDLLILIYRRNNK